MPDDATLSSFGGDDSAGAADDEPALEADDESPAESEPEEEAAEPGDEDASAKPDTPLLTYTFSPDGDSCAACGATVEKRWRAGEGAVDPDALVCSDCKNW